MPLFDEKERTYTGPALHGEPTFRWLNRSADEKAIRLRETLEGWFADYPGEHAADLRARFRSSDDAQHRGAAFELLLHAVLLALGHEVTVHPKTKAEASRQPDFLAEPPDGEPFYLEATLVTGKSDQDRKAEQRKADVYDLLDDLESDNFFLGVSERGTPAASPRTTKMRTFLEDKMRELDPDELAKVFEEEGGDALPRWPFDLNGWELEFYPVPKSPAARGPGARTLGIWGPGEARMVAPGDPVRQKLHEKAKAYGDLELPFVIAFDDLQPFADWESIEEALFGDLVTVVPMLASGRPGPARLKREGNGVWYRGDEPRSTVVNAALACLRLYPWNVTQAPVRVYHNPWSERPLHDQLEALPSARVSDDGRLQVSEGAIFGEILGLPENWPKQETPRTEGS